MSGTNRGILLAGCLCALASGLFDVSRAQSDGGAPELGWSNSLELNLVVTEGNSDSNSFGVKNALRRRWERATFQLKLDAYEFNEGDDRFLLVESGQTWEPGETPVLTATTLVEPGVEPDIAKYFVEGKYDRTISKKFFWNAGVSWDRNEDAGILNRYRAFGGLGHHWKDLEDLHFSTSYGVSYTDREEESPDPLKEDKFVGVRLAWDYMNRFGRSTTYDNDFFVNVSMEDTSDYSMSMDNAIAVSITEHLSLRIGLKFLFEKEPALEDVDVLARLIILDPDGIPGNGDEFFETVDSGGTEIEFGEDRVRKEQLDSTFTTGLVITF